MMDAARLAKVRRFVYISGTGVTLGRGAVTNIDDTVPRGKPLGVLCATRVQSEAEVERVAANGLDAVIVRFPTSGGRALRCGLPCVTSLKADDSGGLAAGINGCPSVTLTMPFTD